MSAGGRPLREERLPPREAVQLEAALRESRLRAAECSIIVGKGRPAGWPYELTIHDRPVPTDFSLQPVLEEVSRLPRSMVTRLMEVLDDEAEFGRRLAAFWKATEPAPPGSKAWAEDRTMRIRIRPGRGVPDGPSSLKDFIDGLPRAKSRRLVAAISEDRGDLTEPRRLLRVYWRETVQPPELRQPAVRRKPSEGSRRARVRLARALGMTKAQLRELKTYRAH